MKKWVAKTDFQPIPGNLLWHLNYRESLEGKKMCVSPQFTPNTLEWQSENSSWHSKTGQGCGKISGDKQTTLNLRLQQRFTMWIFLSGPARVLNFTQSDNCRKTWNCNTFYPTWQKLRASAENNGKTPRSQIWKDWHYTKTDCRL